jgi:hypothetical protein
MLLRGEGHKVGDVHEDWGTKVSRVREDTCAVESAWWPVTDGKYDGVGRASSEANLVMAVQYSILPDKRFRPSSLLCSCGGSAGVAANLSVPLLGRAFLNMRGCARALCVVLE